MEAQPHSGKVGTVTPPPDTTPQPQPPHQHDKQQQQQQEDPGQADPRQTDPGHTALAEEYDGGMMDQALLLGKEALDVGASITNVYIKMAQHLGSRCGLPPAPLAPGRKTKNTSRIQMLY